LRTSQNSGCRAIEIDFERARLPKGKCCRNETLGKDVARRKKTVARFDCVTNKTRYYS